MTDLNREYLLSEQGAAIKREIPVGRFGEERDLDGALLLLVSDAGRFIAGDDHRGRRRPDGGAADGSRRVHR